MFMICWTLRRKLESQHTLVLTPTTSSKTNLSESSEKNNVNFIERVPFSCQSNTVNTENMPSQLSVNFELSETQVQMTSTKQNEDSETSVFLFETPDNMATCLDPVLTIMADFDPLTNSSSEEIPITIDKMSSDFSQKQKSFCEDTLTTPETKLSSETAEMSFQDPMSDSSFASDNNKQVDYLETSQNNDSASEIHSLVSCPRMDLLVTKKHLIDQISMDSLDIYNYHYSGGYEREDKTTSQGCDISVSDVDDICVSNIDASDTTILTQEPKVNESSPKPDFDLLVEENKMYNSGEKQHKDIVINDDDVPSGISSLAHFSKDDGQTKQKEDITVRFQHATTSQDLDFMADPSVEYHEDLNILAKFVALENVPLNQDPTSREPKSELASDQPSPKEHQGSCDEEDQPFGVQLQTSQTVDETAEFTFMVSWPKMDNGQNKECLTSNDPEKDDSADVVEKHVNKTFQAFASSQDFDVPATSTVDETDMLHASSKAAPEVVSSPTEHQGSCDEDQPFGLLIQKNQTVNKTAELSFMVSWPKMDKGQNKESLTSNDPEKDGSADVFEKHVSKTFKDLANSQDFDVPATSTANKIDMLHASSKAEPEVVSSRFFGFEELIPTIIERPIDDVRPKAGSQYSEHSVTTMEVFENRTSLDSDQALSPSENEYCIPPGYDEISTDFDYNTVQTKAASPTFEVSDTEAYFDCKQGASDISETESEEPNSKLHQQSCHYPKNQRNFQQTLLPSESEDYEDCPFTYEPLCNVQEENEEDSSDEEFTLCEAPPKTTFCETDARNSGGDDEDTNESMSREIKAQLGTLSESSDDEFLTTRIIRRRVIIKADEMADCPPESVSEETYTDENGHTVVKKVTRRVIRKCTSSDDAALDQVSSEVGAHSSIKVSQGDGYSKVVKRTIVKSEGDESEVTFTECESLLKQDTAEGGRASRVEKTIVLEGEQTVTHCGNVSLASDLPSAQDDFKQALSYVSFHETELPRVVHRETVKDDGTLVKRAQICKGRSRRRTAVKGAGQRKQVLLEGPGLGSKSSDLKQHLHQLFHRYYEQTHGEDTDEEDV